MIDLKHPYKYNSTCRETMRSPPMSHFLENRTAPLFYFAPRHCFRNAFIKKYSTAKFKYSENISCLCNTMLYILGTLVPLCFRFISCRVFSVSSSVCASAASAFVVFATAARRKSKKQQQPTATPRPSAAVRLFL
jgi:hypothetical protein